MQMPVFSRLSAYAVTMAAVTIGAVTMGALLAGAGTALAAVGQPSPWGMDLQEAASPVMADITVVS